VVVMVPPMDSFLKSEPKNRCFLFILVDIMPLAGKDG